MCEFNKQDMEIKLGSATPPLSQSELCTHRWFAACVCESGVCVGKADVSEAAGSPALSLLW